MGEAELRDLYRKTMRHPSAGREGCVPPERLRDLAEGRGAESERLTLLDHVMACEACLREFELLRALVHARPREERWPKRRHLAIAASVVLLLGAGIVWRQVAGPEAPDTFRGAEDVVVVAPEDGVVAAPVTFVWRSVEGALDYEIELSDADGNAVYRGTTPDTLLALPASVTLAPGATYAWWVHARLRDGRMKRSSVHLFSLEPR